MLHILYVCNLISTGIKSLPSSFRCAYAALTNHYLFKVVLFSVLIVLTVPAVQVVAQPNVSVFPTIQPATGTKEMLRGNPVEILKRAVDAWKDVYDCSMVLHQVEQVEENHPNELWAVVSMIKPTEAQPQNIPKLLLKYYSEPVYESPELIFIAQENPIGSIPKLFTYSPQKKTVRIEYLDEDSILPEFLKLAGFLRFDVEEIQKRAYLESEMYEENINGVPSIRVRLKPRSHLQEVEPDRFIWLDQSNYFPLRFAVDDAITLVVDFHHYNINQGIEPDTLSIKVPQDDVTINDLTR